MAGINDVERKTTFVAYSEAAIDELYYLAQQHVEREVGPEHEPYNIKVGGSGSVLTGDEPHLLARDLQGPRTPTVGRPAQTGQVSWR